MKELTNTQVLAEAKRLRQEMDRASTQFDRDIEMAMRKAQRDFKIEGPTFMESISLFFKKLFIRN